MFCVFFLSVFCPLLPAWDGPVLSDSHTPLQLFSRARALSGIQKAASPHSLISLESAPESAYSGLSDWALLNQGKALWLVLQALLYDEITDEADDAEGVNSETDSAENSYNQFVVVYYSPGLHSENELAAPLPNQWAPREVPHTGEKKTETKKNPTSSNSQGAQSTSSTGTSGGGASEGGACGGASGGDGDGGGDDDRIPKEFIDISFPDDLPDSLKEVAEALKVLLGDGKFYRLVHDQIKARSRYVNAAINALNKQLTIIHNDLKRLQEGESSSSPPATQVSTSSFNLEEITTRLHNLEINGANSVSVTEITVRLNRLQEQSLNQQNTIEQLRVQNREQEGTIEQLRAQLVELSSSSPGQSRSNPQNLVHSYNGQLLWRIDNYQRSRQDAINGVKTALYSPVFYSGQYGYKMCAKIYMNGDGFGKGSHLSLFFVVMKGEYDALQTWPFQKKITLMLLDQGSGNHMVDAFHSDPQSTSFQRPKNDMNIASGSPLFMPLDNMQNRQYIKDNIIFIKVIVD
ncbi:hypothetical protein [Endozoicomonas lisbonensis]|uniref:hypothetical protein n=1 Tax=Endozoicomonas lisbonensis TaxID=3120522 RepID=UPI003399BE55